MYSLLRYKYLKSLLFSTVEVQHANFSKTEDLRDFDVEIFVGRVVNGSIMKAITFRYCLTQY